MGRRHHTPEQIAAALRQLDSGIPAVELCRRLGVHENIMSAWKKKYGSLGTPEIRGLRQLREENTRLKKLIADLALGKTMLRDVISKRGEAGPSQEGRRLSARALPREYAQSCPTRLHRPRDTVLQEKDGSAGPKPSHCDSRCSIEAAAFRLAPNPCAGEA